MLQDDDVRSPGGEELHPARIGRVHQASLALEHDHFG